VSKPLRIRITGDASNPWGVDVHDASTGDRLTNVIAVDCHLERSPAECRVTLTIFGAEFDFIAEADVETVAP
jgi:hypothetical protein